MAGRSVRGAESTPSTDDPFEALIPPELVIGLIGPVGVSLSYVCNSLKHELAEVNYKCVVIRLSDQIANIRGLKTRLRKTPEDKRILSHMRAGTELRKQTQRGDALSLIAVGEIRKEREKITGDANSPAPRTAYILRSLKHKKEVETLRDLYGEAFILLSAYSPKEIRKKSLAKSIQKSRRTGTYKKWLPTAEELINIDETEEGTTLGQNVGGAFPLADVFIDTSSSAVLDRSIKRFIEIIFGYQFHTPQKDEFGMVQAHAAALRSADLSRQVGAAVTSPDGDVISLGCNEVPKAGGGLYWADDEIQDSRDYRLHVDPSAKAKISILGEVLELLNKDLYLNKNYTPARLNSLLVALTEGNKKHILADAQINDLLEFGRTVHAEMTAITDAARRGVSIRGCTLFSTTFPCHICARLIIASGIKRVVYIEPYPKSKTQDLYDDSVMIDPHDNTSGKVSFESFMGIAPRRYMDLFRMGKRKHASGDAVDWEGKSAMPRVRIFGASSLITEIQALKYLEKELRRKNLSL